jgi:hypothetical protein
MNGCLSQVRSDDRVKPHQEDRNAEFASEGLSRQTLPTTWWTMKKQLSSGQYPVLMKSVSMRPLRNHVIKLATDGLRQKHVIQPALAFQPNQGGRNDAGRLRFRLRVRKTIRGRTIPVSIQCAPKQPCGPSMTLLLFVLTHLGSDSRRAVEVLSGDRPK